MECVSRYWPFLRALSSWYWTRRLAAGLHCRCNRRSRNVSAICSAGKTGAIKAAATSRRLTFCPYSRELTLSYGGHQFLVAAVYEERVDFPASSSTVPPINSARKPGSPAGKVCVSKGALSSPRQTRSMADRSSGARPPPFSDFSRGSRTEATLQFTEPRSRAVHPA